MYMSRDLKLGLDFRRGLPEHFGGPPLRVMDFDKTVLRAPWRDLDNFWFSEKFVIRSFRQIIFFFVGSLGSLDPELWSEKLTVLWCCLTKRMKWLETRYDHSEKPEMFFMDRTLILDSHIPLLLTQSGFWEFQVSPKWVQDSLGTHFGARKWPRRTSIRTIRTLFRFRWVLMITKSSVELSGIQ